MPQLTRLGREPVPAEAGGALIIYTSGTTGPPKGVVLAHEALRANLAAVYEAWAWTAADRVVHALPLYHVHGLLLGTLGPLWRGGSSHHVGRFDPHAIGDAVRAGGTMVFGVPTMWNRIVAACEDDPALAAPLAGARLLVSGSAGLPLSLHERLGRVLGRRVIERYGMTETLFTVGERAGTDAAPGSVGTALPDVDLRLAGEEDGLGEIEVRAPWLFDRYLNQEEATRASFTPDGYFRTGDIALRRDDGMLRIVGRRADRPDQVGRLPHRCGGDRVVPARPSGRGRGRGHRRARRRPGRAHRRVGGPASPRAGRRAAGARGAAARAAQAPARRPGARCAAAERPRQGAEAPPAARLRDAAW